MRRQRSIRAGLAAAAVLIVVLGVIAFEVISTGEAKDRPHRAPDPEGRSTSAPDSTTGRTRDLDETDQTTSSEANAAEPERSAVVHWDASLATALPVSTTDGPSHVTPTVAAGFTRTERGAALAAVHLMARTSPRVGPAVFTPTMDDRVRGPNRTALAISVQKTYDAEAARLGVRPGAPLPGADAEVLGYRTVRASRTDAVVEVMLSSASLRVNQSVAGIRVTLQWAEGDWQLVAPPRGDWAVVTTVADSVPSDVNSYDGGR